MPSVVKMVKMALMITLLCSPMFTLVLSAIQTSRGLSGDEEEAFEAAAGFVGRRAKYPTGENMISHFLVEPLNNLVVKVNRNEVETYAFLDGAGPIIKEGSRHRIVQVDTDEFQFTWFFHGYRGQLNLKKTQGFKIHSINLYPES
ncbi:uncharacterized protein MELLADRAFT_124024 [Melampsora larici-populina 98AG31]|uniref:Secreted protein n=1 Tax=Melampsora larici-populina (strain 98AG31 / pathotype 3-4-7) TaxID=747676 RepID=F4S302_MELLP|nr:uncharacterized protein MELLADRAFT_124024 [Melampsora larici-populina 98AG31]EGG00892.1 secreted protein [Melampsora larici-populina 98AG31]